MLVPLQRALTFRDSRQGGASGVGPSLNETLQKRLQVCSDAACI